MEQKSSAPNLYGFASRAWIAGLLDPGAFAGSEYFGHTAHKEGEMVGFVTDSLKDWPAEEVHDAVIALSAEAGLKSQSLADGQDATRVEAGKKAIANTEHCAMCHKFHEAGELGSAPDLTGYGSRDWLLGMISNPAHERFYRDDNDRMPAFAEQPEDSPRNRLSTQSLHLIVDWLRGEWYEPPVDAASQPAAPSRGRIAKR